MKKISFISILLLCTCISCNSNNLKNKTIKEIVIDITPDTIFNNLTKDSIYNKKVLVSSYFGFYEEDKNSYFVKIFYNGNDSLMSFLGSFSEEMSFNKAKYYWNSDSSINMTLFNTNNKNVKFIFLNGSMDGKSGSNGYR